MSTEDAREAQTTDSAAEAPALLVRQPGLMSSIQDQGRPGMAALALSRGGAVDLYAAATANRLVGNDPADAVLEVTGPGPCLEIPCDLWLASFGARHVVRAEEVAGRPLRSPIVLPLQRPVFLPAASVLRWDGPTAGWRSWVAVAGGIRSPMILASRSAHLAAAIGPGKLAKGSAIKLLPRAEAVSRNRARHLLREAAFNRAHQLGEPAWPRWCLADPIPRGWPLINLPVLPGRHWPALTEATRLLLLSQEWAVSAQSNRQGLRLEPLAGKGASLDATGFGALASEAMALGTVQLPPSGCPVILLAEHQTTGGYPRVLEVASAAIGLLAQASGGSRIRFHCVGLGEADGMLEDLARIQARVAQSLADCYRGWQVTALAPSPHGRPHPNPHARPIPSPHTRPNPGTHI
jgi:antagonist of KipI